MNGWRKSSYSFANGNCLEARWHASSHSNSGNCVQARRVGTVQVRDSKDPGGPVLEFTEAAWRAFLATLRPQPVRRIGPAQLFVS